MQRLKNILLLNWNSQKINEALDHAIHMAKLNNADLKIIEIVASHDDTLTGQVKQSYRGNRAELIRHQYGGGRYDSLRKLKGSGLDAECKIMPGMSSKRILDEVKQHHHDLVIIGVGDNRDYFGYNSGTLINLLRRCAVPVWIVKPSPIKKSGRVLAAVDPAPAPGPFAESANLLNRQIMLTANHLALMGNHEIDVLHCWMQPMEDRLRGELASKPKDIDKILNRTRRRHRIWLNHLLKGIKNDQIDYRIHLKKGKAHELIPDFARKYRIDLVIMGNFGRTGVDGLFVGNTAEKILCQTDVSLLSVKSYDFIDIPSLSVADPEAVCEPS
jgi:nucleotide-binding universal stress UspA family protein